MRGFQVSLKLSIYIFFYKSFYTGCPKKPLRFFKERLDIIFWAIPPQITQFLANKKIMVSIFFLRLVCQYRSYKREILEYEPECIHLDCVKKLGIALDTYFEKKVNFDDPSNETNICTEMFSLDGSSKSRKDVKQKSSFIIAENNSLSFFINGLMHPPPTLYATIRNAFSTIQFTIQQKRCKKKTFARVHNHQFSKKTK